MHEIPVRLSVFGLGYVGAISAACLANENFQVIGVEPQRTKVDQINLGRSPIVEPGLDALIWNGTRTGRLRATADPIEAVCASDVSMVSVGTPSQSNGRLDLSSLISVCTSIGQALRAKTDFHVVVIRSTILPGTMNGLVRPLLEDVSGKKAGIDFGLCNNPEFLREGSAIHDFYHPSRTVIGSNEERSFAIVTRLYDYLDAPLIRTSIETAELVKYTDNVWHALKVAFGNEIGNIAKALGIDSHEVMEIFSLDTKLNLSRSYLKPGFAFGGSCLPKDLRALNYEARMLGLDLPVLSSILPSNRNQVDRALQMIVEKARHRISVLGFSFKAGTDDMRESPMVELIERLIGKGYDLRLYDGSINLTHLTGANRDFIMKAVPHIARLMVDNFDEIIDHAELVIVGNNDPSFYDIPAKLNADQILIDLVNLPDRGDLGDRYIGINW
jgi:GDP-mannose 6-dehydrogenase